MKVLIVLGGDAPGVELLKSCVQEADFSIAADRGLEAFDAAGLEPDMLIGDMDSVSPDVLYETLCHDKKASDGTVKIVRVEKIGTHTLSTVPLSEMKTLLRKPLK